MSARLRRRRLFGYSSARTQGERRSARAWTTFTVLVVSRCAAQEEEITVSPLALSVVTPMFNEREAVDHFVARLRPVLDGLGVPYEVVAVDDGRSRGTVPRLVDLRAGWDQLRVVALRRNVGHQAALAAGLRSARG